MAALGRRAGSLDFAPLSSSVAAAVGVGYYQLGLGGPSLKQKAPPSFGDKGFVNAPVLAGGFRQHVFLSRVDDLDQVGDCSL